MSLCHSHFGIPQLNMERLLEFCQGTYFLQFNQTHEQKMYFCTVEIFNMQVGVENNILIRVIPLETHKKKSVAC